MMQIPLLKRYAKVSSRGERMVVDYLTDQITMDGAAADLFGRMLPHFGGGAPLSQIAGTLGEPVTRVQALADELRGAGVLTFVDAAPPPGGRMTSGEEFYALHRRYVAYWLREVYDHPLWERIATGAASRAQVLGFAFEKYHYIEGAYEHMGIAAANATPELMPHLARHFIEEYTHGDIYRKGLMSLFPDRVVVEAQPLPSTRALINFLSEAAGRSSFAYYAGNELLQMTENTGDANASRGVDDFYAAMIEHYPYTRKLVDSFIAHTRADQKLGHEDVFLEMCRSVPPMTEGQVADAMNTVRSMAEHLVLFLDGIDTFYGAFPTLPRVPCELLSE
jgi:pyrroloquinoline quinone (PQQ) biosynthesis protein C